MTVLRFRIIIRLGTHNCFLGVAICAGSWTPGGAAVGCHSLRCMYPHECGVALVMSVCRHLVEYVCMVERDEVRGGCCCEVNWMINALREPVVDIGSPRENIPSIRCSPVLPSFQFSEN